MKFTRITKPDGTFYYIDKETVEKIDSKAEMQWSVIETVIMIFSIGLGLLPLRIIIMFFPIFYYSDVILFGGLGYILGKKVSGGKWIWGLLLSFPSLLFALYTVQNIGLSSILKGIGSWHLISVVIIPLCSCMGICFRVRKKSKNQAE